MKILYYGLVAMSVSLGASADCSLTASQNNVALGEHDIGMLSQQPTLLTSHPLQYQLNCDAPVLLQGFTLRDNPAQAIHSGPDSAPASYLSVSIDAVRNENGEQIAFSLSPEQVRQTHLQQQRLPADSEGLQLFLPDALRGQHFTLSLTAFSYATSATHLRQLQRDQIPLSGQLQVSASYLEL